jgi:hypothetical protein
MYNASQAQGSQQANANTGGQSSQQGGQQKADGEVTDVDFEEVK